MRPDTTERHERLAPPPDAKDAEPRGGWRAAGWLGADDDDNARWSRWVELHERRRLAVRQLRRAGYVARARWARRPAGMRRVGRVEVPSWRYLDGPAAGLEAVDPWYVGASIASCGGTWKLGLRWSPTYGPTVAPSPVLCGRRSACPVCAGRRSASVAAALRDLTRASGAPVVLVTLTQRAAADEPLTAALGRLDQAWDRMTKGRPGRRWASVVAGCWRGREVTRGDGATRERPGPHWHPHAHVLVQLRDDADPVEARATVADLWLAATRAASGDLAWSPASMGLRPPLWDAPPGASDRARAAARWWSPVDSGDPREVYQAAKYPSPLADLHAVPLAEWCAVAHGRRWQQGGGIWHRAIALADAIEADGDAPADDSIAVGSIMESPHLDVVAPGLGRRRYGYPGGDRAPRWSDPAPQARPDDPSSEVRWSLSAATVADSEILADLSRRVGIVEQDRHGRWWVSAAAADAADLLRAARERGEASDDDGRDLRQDG